MSIEDLMRAQGMPPHRPDYEQLATDAFPDETYDDAVQRTSDESVQRSWLYFFDRYIEARDAVRSVVAVVEQQARDDALWHHAETAPEAYIQRELRRLHAAVEIAGKLAG